MTSSPADFVDHKPLIVMKFGGTSVGDFERIKSVAQLIVKAREKQTCVVVVSAMAGATNDLVQMGRSISKEPWPEAYDMLLASGEQVSCALLALALRDLGVEAVPLLAQHAGILTEGLSSKARIKSVDAARIFSLLNQNQVPIVAGFQGVRENGVITTLGRGGSDTSAVAIAVALQAQRCDIYTDVLGVYTSDPRIVTNAKLLNVITFSEMMELASLGAKVLHMRSVELAAKYCLPLRVRSTFYPSNEGTLLVSDKKINEDFMLESPVVSAITSERNQSLIQISVPNDSKASRFPAKIFSPLAHADINLDIIIEGQESQTGTTQFNITVADQDGNKALRLLNDFSPVLKIQNAAKLSIVGIGMKSHTGVASRLFEILEQANIPIHLVTSSEITISILIDEKNIDNGLRSLHEGFGLSSHNS